MDLYNHSPIGPLDVVLNWLNTGTASLLSLIVSMAYKIDIQRKMWRDGNSNCE
jgi:hypothetical protein